MLSANNDTDPPALPPQAILAHCRERLAMFKVPRFYAYVGEFPRTISTRSRSARFSAASTI